MDLTHENILVTGGHGFLGHHVLRRLMDRGCKHVTAPWRRDCDLVSGEATRALLRRLKPTVVIHLAARVGGIGANRAQPACFFYDNAMMGLQLLHESYQCGVKKFVAVGTICAYPSETHVPFVETDLWNGYPEPTNAPYGIAKKILSVQAAAYRQQYGFNAVVVYPTNLYGPGDNFDLHTSHVIPALIRKFDEARERGDAQVELWGDGTPTREFLYVRDCADGLVHAVEHYDSPDPMNLGSGMEVSIRWLSDQIRQLVGFTGSVTWNPRQPNGQQRRCVDTRFAERMLDFRATTPFSEGLATTVRWWRQEVVRAKQEALD